MALYTLAADYLHEMKYRSPGESHRDSCNRQAATLKDSEEHFRAYRDILIENRFSPGGRIQSAIGSAKQVTAINCLAGKTKILTREFGAIEIEKVANTTITLFDGNGNWLPCYIYDHGVQTTYALTFKGGFETIEIRSTLEHGWIQGNGYTIRTKAFTSPNGKIEIEDLRPTKIINDITIYTKGILHGIIYGDGTYNPERATYHMRFCNEKNELIKYIALLEHTVTYPECFAGDAAIYIPASYTTLNLKELPINPGDNLDYLLGFIRGWLSTDGCVSNQPEATICGDETEMHWLDQWGPLVGIHIRGFTKLASETNYGLRNKESLNIRIKKSSLNLDDFLRSKHLARWQDGHNSKIGHSWRIHGQYDSPKIERVYCPVVGTTHSFALSCGIHSANCFVSGSIADSFIEGPGNIMQRATEAAATMRMGGGIGYDFSPLRPRGDLIRKLQSHSSGPVSFMEIFNAVCKTVASSGHRRGAQMGVLRVDHPDIVQFINAKHDQSSLTGFNISVGITREFMEAVITNKPFNLKFNDIVYNTVDAVELFEMIMRSTWDWAEPGVIFLDTVNDMNNLYYCENISASNPCGEQMLPPYGSCLLGSFVLPKYLRRQPIPVRDVSNGTYSGYSFDSDLFLNDIPHVVRAMDNVTDKTYYPLKEQEHEQKSKRRMGIGITGLANCAEALGYQYGSLEFLGFEDEILGMLTFHTYKASALLAKEKGSFPLYDEEKYLKGKFIQTLDEENRDLIKKYGIRNSHLTSIAPTGTISMTSDNVSSGIEPVFSYAGPRTIQTIDGPIEINLEDYGYKFLGVKGKLARDVTVQDHINVLLTAQRHIDSACSKTINCPNSTPWEDFKNIYIDAWQGGAKGCSTFTIDGKRAGLLKEGIETTSCEINPDTGEKECG